MNEIFKEKEESEVVQKSLDPELGLKIEEIDLNNLYKENEKEKTLKLQAYKETHQNKEKPSNLKELDETYKHQHDNFSDFITVEELPEDYTEVLLSVEELIEYLDSTEEQIDV